MKKIKTLCMILALAAVVASCKKDDETTITLYGDAAITGFTLGTMNRYVDGVKSTYAGSVYKFHIDQVNHRIFNTDSLPVGTDKAHVLCTVSTMNNGSVWIESLSDPNMVEYYSAYDSIDFTTDRQFEVYASDGSGYSSYTVSLNVHKQEGEEFVWKQAATNNDIAAMTGLKAVSNKGVKYVFGNTGGTTRILATTDGTTWTFPTPNINTTFAADAWKNVTVKKDTIFMLNNSMLLKCTDGTDWEQITISTPGLNLKQLLGASTGELYALADDNMLWRSKDSGCNWQQEETDESAALLPVQDIAMVSYPMQLADSTDQVVMAGNRSTTDYPADEIAMVWRKIADYQKYAPQGHWTYMERTDHDKYALPRMQDISLWRYDGAILALGGAGIGGSTVSAYSKLYQSRDNGITWKENATYVMPADFDSSATAVTVAVDEQNYIWLFAAGTGQVWRGRLNRLGWDE